MLKGIGVGEAAGEHRLDGGLDLDAGGYSLGHGVVSICGFATSALEPTPPSLFQRSQDATLLRVLLFRKQQVLGSNPSVGSTFSRVEPSGVVGICAIRTPADP